MKIKFSAIIDEENQMSAVNQNGWALIYCHNPSEAVQSLAVKKDGLVLQS